MKRASLKYLLLTAVIFLSLCQSAMASVSVNSLYRNLEPSTVVSIGNKSESSTSYTTNKEQVSLRNKNFFEIEIEEEEEKKHSGLTKSEITKYFALICLAVILSFLSRLFENQSQGNDSQEYLRINRTHLMFCVFII